MEKITKHEFENTHELFLLKDGSPRKEAILRLHLRRTNEFYDTILYAPYFGKILLQLSHDYELKVHFLH